MPNNNKNRASEVPLSECTIPTRLADIRRKCSDLLSADGEIALSIEDDAGHRGPESAGGAYNPYNRTR
jgi:hypothetical protein